MSDLKSAAREILDALLSDEISRQDGRIQIAIIKLNDALKSDNTLEKESGT